MVQHLLGYLNGAAAIVVVLGLCLLFHEFGHFIVAKLMRMRVDDFALGMGPTLLKFQRGETTYRLNLVPMGAYVRIAGMDPGAGPVERGFYSRPRWAGALVILAGSFCNLLLAIVLFTVTTIWTGAPDPTDQGIYLAKVVPGQPAARGGLAAGDRLVGVDGQRQSLSVARVKKGSVAAQLGLRKDLSIERADNVEVFVPAELARVVRAGKGTALRLTVVDYAVANMKDQQKIFTVPLSPALRQAAQDPSGAALSSALGLGFDQLSQQALVGYISNHKSVPVTFTIERAGQFLERVVTTEVTYSRYALRDATGKVYSRILPIGRIGVVLRGASRPVALGEGLKFGVLKSLSSSVVVIVSIQAMLQKQVEAELAGPVAIMAISAERARIGWDAVLNWGGIISSILGVMNLFPIPPFDGFRAVLLGYEAIIRRRIDARKELIISVAGFMLIIVAFVALTAKDLANLLRYGTP